MKSCSPVIKESQGTPRRGTKRRQDANPGRPSTSAERTRPQASQLEFERANGVPTTETGSQINSTLSRGILRVPEAGASCALGCLNKVPLTHQLMFPCWARGQGTLSAAWTSKLHTMPTAPSHASPILPPLSAPCRLDQFFIFRPVSVGSENRRDPRAQAPGTLR